MKKLLIIFLAFFIYSSTYAISDNLKQAIEQSKQTQLLKSQEQAKQNMYASKKASLEKQIKPLITKLNTLTESYKLKDVTQIEKGIKVYTNAVNKLNIAINKFASSNKELHRIVYVAVLTDLRNAFEQSKNILVSAKNSKIITSSNNSSSGSGSVSIKKEFINITNILNDIKGKLNNNTYNLLDTNQALEFETYIESKGISPLEASLISWKNFKFCANFTPDIYKDISYSGAYSDITKTNILDINSCFKKIVSIQNEQGVELTQDLVKTIYEKYYDTNFNVWNEGITDIDELELLQNTIGNYQNIDNYNLKYIRTDITDY